MFVRAIFANIFISVDKDICVLREGVWKKPRQDGKKIKATTELKISKTDLNYGSHRILSWTFSTLLCHTVTRGPDCLC